MVAAGASTAAFGTAAAIASIFQRAGCDGYLCALDIDSDTTGWEFRAHVPVVVASVVKIPIALEFAVQVAAGRLVATDRRVLAAGHRTPGPTGISALDDDVELSLRDLAMLMMSVSDNAATDAILDMVGVEAVAHRMVQLGLHQTVVLGGIRSMIDAIARDMGFASWEELTDAQSGRLGEETRARSLDRVLMGRSTGLEPAATSRSTAHEMARLVQLVWTDAAAAPAACAEMRRLMGAQVNRQRIMSVFDDNVRVSAKSGSLAGVVRNEVAVVEFPDGGRYAVAVFTRAHTPFVGENAINSAIGEAAVQAVHELRS